MTVTMKTLKNREEWLQHRQNYIGGSEASAVIGMNPYMDNITLWELKTGRLEPEDISDKPYVQYGIQAEDHLRELFKLDYPGYFVGYVENNSILNDRYPWAAASLDGMLMEKNTGRKGILEIKTTNILQSMQREKWNDRIPPNYYAQTIHYLAVTEFDYVILKAALKSEYDGEIRIQTRHYHIERRDVEEDIRYLMEEERKFWECVVEDRRPPLVLPAV